MKIKFSIVLISIFFAAICAITAFAQENTPPVQSIPVSSQELSMYGEVKSVNAKANSISIQYYDYDSDSEMTAEITLNAQSKIENAASLNDIKEGDWLDLTYEKMEGKNVARIIRVEKDEAEDLPPESAEDYSDDEGYDE